MIKLKKWLIRILCSLLIIVVILTGIGALYIRISWPDTDGTVNISKDVFNDFRFSKEIEVFSGSDRCTAEIIRDKWGVPNIYADNDFSLLFAQGYVHAQDRLWQMEISRRGSSGTMSEVFGEFAIDVDKYMRTFGISRIAQKSWMEMDEYTKSMLLSYSEGINYYIKTHKNSLPVEFKILGIDPKPWTPVDSLAMSNIMSFYMSYNHTLEVVRAKLISENGVDILSELFPNLDNNIIPSEVEEYKWLKCNNKNTLNSIDLLNYNAVEKWGSNNWVVHGSLTESGKPILANDTHMSLGLPSSWYENGLHGDQFNCIGYTFPGIPAIITGHNKNISWGITNMNVDVQDLYIERLDDIDNPTKYEYMGKWYDINVIQEMIPVKGKKAVEHKVYVTRHGPIINKQLNIPKSHPVALKWTLYEGNTLLQSLMKINKANNWDEFRSALKYWDNAAQNFVYADTNGNIGYQAACKVPIRVPKHQGTVPVPGWTGEYEWQDYIPFDKLPVELNPSEGFIATANNKITPEGYPYVLSYDWSYNIRVERIKSLLNKKQKLSANDMKEIQTDVYSLFAEEVRPYLLAVKPTNEKQKKALEQIAKWDLNSDINSIGASIFETWYNFMIKNVFAKKLGIEENVESFQIMGTYMDYSDFHQPAMEKLLKIPDSKWFDDKDTLQTESRDDIILQSLDDAISWLNKEYGSDIKKWEWGRIHTVTFAHMPFGSTGFLPLEKLFNSKTMPCPGSLSTINVAQFNWNTPFMVSFGTSQRTVIDMNDFDNSASINSTGQTGQIFHKNREDQIYLWADNKYKSMYFTKEHVKANEENKLVINFH